MVGQDIFAEARKAKIAFQKAIERPKRNKFDKTKVSLLEKVINNEVPEDQIVQKIISSRGDDFAKMKDFLIRGSGDSGKQAWLDLKAQILRDALDSATSTAGKTATGERVFNANRFKAKLSKLRTSNKFTELFNPDEIKLIDDIIEIGRLRIPQGQVFTGKGPSELIGQEVKQAIFDQIPGIGPRANAIKEALTAARTDKRLLDVTGPTEEALR